MTTKPVRIGQVYRDRNDMTSGGRVCLRIIVIGPLETAACERVWKHGDGLWETSSSSPEVRIRLDRLTSSRFELVEDVTG